MKNTRKSSPLKNKGTMFLVIRVAEGGKEVVTECTTSYEKAEWLIGEHEQLMREKGFTPEEIHFYMAATTYYE